ncbi:MAG: hypothetical protein JJU20_11580 [Opitutales bacterium]|nr:hypothetical protein [Opitutales bacterium]
MLKGISPLLSPELLACLHRMGHGDEIVLADAHFPAESFNSQVLRADGSVIVASQAPSYSAECSGDRCTYVAALVPRAEANPTHSPVSLV